MSSFTEKSARQAGNRSLSSQAADRMRRRRDMAFIKYGSDQKKQNPALSSRTREHAKMLAMKISNDVSSPMSIQSTSTFADFGSAFANSSQPEVRSSATSRRDFFADKDDPFNSRDIDSSFHSASSSSFFGDDGFASVEQFPTSAIRRTPQKNTTARQNTPSIKEENEFDAFATNWPSNEYESSITMATMPANSSMQAKFVHHNAVSTPERSPPQTISESTSGGGGAAARRRMRRQMRSSGPRSVTEDSSVESMSTESHSPQQTMRRGAAESSARKQTDRVSNYSVHHNHRHSFTSANQSVNSSESGSEHNVWNTKQTNGGFTFDAFGLDANQINQQVSDAINDLAVSEHSFLDYSHNGWDSPVASRSSTPNPLEDGFADIRVNNYHSHAVHVRHSPTSTERSSLTDDLEKTENASVNLFKERAGFHRSPGRGHPSVRPEIKELTTSASGDSDGFRGRLQRQFTAQRASYNKTTSPQHHPTMQMKRTAPSLSMHAVNEAHSTQQRRVCEAVSSPRSHEDVEFYDSASEASETMHTEINALSDAGVAPRLNPSSYRIPFDDRKARKDAIPDNLTESTSATTLEEKKDDEHMRTSGAQTSRTEQPERSAGRWQDKNNQQERDSRFEPNRAYMGRGQSSFSHDESRRSLSPPKKTWTHSAETSRNSPNRPNFGYGKDAAIQDGKFLYQHTSEPASYARSDEYPEPNSRSSPGPATKPAWLAAREQILAPKEKEADYIRRADRNEEKSAKSEGGAANRHSHLNSVLNKMGIQSPADSRSEAGASLPAFLGIQLNMTLSGNASERNAGGVAHRMNAENVGTIEEGVNHQEERKMTYAERRKIEIENEKLQAARMAEEASIARANGGKLTYREKRELELRKQQQDEANQSDGHDDTKEKDVAALIKKRIAENRKNSKVDEHDKKTSSAPNYRDVLKPTTNNGHDNDKPSKQTNGYVSEGKPQSNSIEYSPIRLLNNRGDNSASLLRADERQSKPSDLSPSRNADFEDRSARQASNNSPNPQVSQLSSPPRNRNQDTESTSPRRTNLVIETECSVSRSKEEPNAALSHMLMLQQLQQRGLSKNAAASPTRPTGQSSAKAENGEDQARNKAHTPKATMMMLNAFLAGKESVSSPSGGAMSPHEKGPEEVQSPVQEPAPGSFPALKDDPRYTRFFKMLKLGMPMDVVKHAMTREGMDPSVMDGDHNKPVGIPLKLDPTYSKYFRMLSIGLPMEAVKHSMARDGLDPAVMDQDHDLPATAIQKPTKETEKDQDSHRRARLHWNPLRKVTRNSLWAKIDQEDNIQIDIDEKEFQELFQAEKTAETATKTAKQENGKRSATVRVIDPKRANNGGIILARLKMSHDEMADAVDRIDEYAMNAEQIENMIEYLPTKNERKALETYMLEGGQDAAEKFDGLCECEKFMVSMMTVKHAKRKVRALLFKLQFETFVRDIQKEAFLVEGACDELSNSVRLRQLLGIILEFGNRLNTAGSGNQQKAGAFTIDSLLKLKQAKAFDKKTTFLEYVIRIVNRNNEFLLRFEDDIPTVFKADKVSWEQCINDLEEVENQLENVRRMALYQARHTHAYGLKKKTNKEDDESLSDAEEEFSLEEEVEALKSTQIGMFTLSAIKYISALRDKIEETKYKFSSLLEYFGEENKNKQPHDIFSTFVRFCRDFNEAKEHVFSEEKKKQREERKRQATKASGPQEGKPPSYSPAQLVSKRPAHSVKASPPRSNGVVRVSDHQPSVSKVMAHSTARTLEVSPQPPEHYGRGNGYHQPPQTEPKSETQRPRNTMYNDDSNRGLSPYQHYSPGNSYETEASQPIYENESSSPSAYQSESPPAIEPSLSQHSTSSSHMAAMRAKARMRRQRNAKR